MKYPIYPITFSYVSGIFCSHFFGLGLIMPLFLVCAAFVTLIFLYLTQVNKGFYYVTNNVTWLVICILFLGLGASVHNLNNKKASIENLNQTEFTIQIDEVLKSNLFAHRAYGTLLSDSLKPRIVLSFPNTHKSPIVGEIYKMVGSISEVAPPRNSYDFNYKQYLEHKQIYYQVRSYHPPVKIAEVVSFNSVSVSIRNYLVKQFKHLGYDAKTQGFTEALLFGIKTNLDDELHQQFQDFGILHLLAVSGMHVVLLFTTVSYILKYLRVPKMVTPIVLISFLFVFCVMAGFSASVVRATLMCVMGMIGFWSRRNVDTINLMVGSMLIILVIAPNYLFDIGFQLSYLAVFSIVYCYPVIRRFFYFKNKILNYFGQLIGVSLIAQLGVLPLSILYFKQIPLLFLIGNLVAIPLVSFLLISWFVQLILSLFLKDLAAAFTPLLNYISTFCFETLSNLSNYFSVKTIDFYLSPEKTIVLLLLIFSCFWFVKSKKASRLFIFLICVLTFQTISIIHLISQQATSEIVLLSDNNDVVILNRSGLALQQLGTGNEFANNSVKNYLLHNGIKTHSVHQLPHAFSLNKESWLVIDSLSLFPKQQVDYIVLSHNPKLNVERLINYTQPKFVIFHRSIYPSLLAEYTAYLQYKKIPYYDMRSEGSFVIPYNSDNN